MSCTTRDLGEFVLACHRIGAYGLVRCSSGNLSWRLDEDDDLIAISGTRAWLGELEESDVALCQISDGQSLNDQKPSVEVGMHLGIHANCKDVNVVLHFQTPCATALACGRPEKVNFFVIPEIPYYIGPIGIVDYHTPGTAELAAATATVMQNHNLALLKNHGQIVVGKTFDEVIQNAAFFELACEIIVKGNDIQPLSPQAIENLKNAYSG